MKMLHVGEFQTRFTSVLKDVSAGNEVAITSGRKKQAVAVIVPFEKWTQRPKRKLGTLENKMTVTFADDFAMTDEELVCV